MQSFLRSCVAACTLAFAVAQPAIAANAPATPEAAYIQKLGDQVLSTISDKKIAQAAKQATIERLFKENLDFEWVSKFVMARFWRQATNEQKARFLEAYKNFLTKHYTSRFSEYTSGSFQITGSKELEKGDVQVSMEIAATEKGAQPILIDYKIHKAGGRLKVYDIVVEGVSLITTQRSEFGSVLNQSGIDALISQLQAK